MTRTLTFEGAVRLAREAVAEKPEGYVYTNEFGDVATLAASSCTNWHLVDPGDDNSKRVPGCIVGTILYKAGIPLESMGKAAPSYDLIYSIRHIMEVDEKAAKFLSACQSHQDIGTPWDESVAMGIKRAEANF